MANRQRRWAQFATIKLKQSLGCKCAKCGKKRRKLALLEFDCIIPQGDKHHKFETNRRICFYRRMLKEGNLQLLCAEPCHRRKTKADFQKEMEPF